MPGKKRPKSNPIIPNQVFIGCPWSIRKKYENVMDKLKSKYPLSFIIIGRTERQDAEDLLAIIKDALLSSSYAIFDASYKNPNVALEYGFAEASEIPRSLYLCTHGRGVSKEVKDPSIIADLAGKQRMQYKQENALHELLEKFCKSHNYCKLFERFMRESFGRSKKGKKKRYRALAFKIIHALDNQKFLRRDDVIQGLLVDMVKYKEREIDDMLKRLHKKNLVKCKVGRYSTVSIG